MAIAGTAKINMKLLGHRQLMHALRQFKPSVRRRIMRPAMRKAARIIVRDAKALAPKETGLLKRSIGMRMRVSGKTGNILVVIGPRHGFGAKVTRDPKGKLVSLHTRKRQSQYAGAETVYRNPTKYAHLVEFGSAPHVQAGKLKRLGDRMVARVRHPGAPAKPFLRPALQRNKGRAMNTIRAEAWRQLQRYAEKLRKRQKRVA